MKNVLGPAIRLFGVLTLITGVVYPVAVTAVARLGMADLAGGSLVQQAGRVVGSDLVAQSFTQERYFWPRPSACGYATVASGASNLGPASEKLRLQVTQRTKELSAAHGLSATAPVPSELVTTSASGLDPHLSRDAVLFQVPRVARARGVPEAAVRTVIERLQEPSVGGWLGVARVNVMRLNLSLDGAE